MIEFKAIMSFSADLDRAGILKLEKLAKDEWQGAELDVTGHKCPVPVLRLRRALEKMPSGSILRVRTTDPMTMIDVPHFCREGGHDLLESSKMDNIFIFLVKKASE